MPSRYGVVLAAVLAVTLALPACAQETDSEPPASPADGDSAPLVEEVTVHELTCGEIGEMLRDEASEEEASYVVVWAYGIRTGVEGLDFEKYPVSKDGLKEFVTRTTLVCDADPAKLFVDAILE